MKAVLVDDHALVRKGLRTLLVESSHIDVVGEAGDYDQWLALSGTTPHDMLIVDIDMPGRDGFDIISTALQDNPAINVMVLSGHSAQTHGIRSLKAGALSYMSKSADPHDIVLAATRVASGQTHVTPELSALLVDNCRNKQSEDLHETLSKREKQTMLAIARGEKLAAMAQRFKLSTKTVSVYRARLLEKLGVTTNAAVAAYAFRHKLID